MIHKCHLTPIKGIVLFLIILVFCESAWAQQPGIWETHGPARELKSISSFITNPINSHILYTQAGTTVLQSTDFGLTWSVADPPLDKGISSMILVRDTLFTVSKREVYRSADGGLTWIKTSISAEVQQLKEFDSVLFALTDGNGIFYSLDIGNTWTQVNAPMHDKAVTILIKANDTLYAGTDNNGVFRSVDGGINWSQTETSLGNKRILHLFYHDGRLTSVTEYKLDAFYSSTDGGETWRRSTAPRDAPQIISLLTVGGTIYAGTGEYFFSDVGNRGVYYSSDGGLNWTRSINLAFDSVYSLFENNGRLFAATFYLDDAGTMGPIYGGLYLSDDGGRNWTQSPLSFQKITEIFSSGGVLYAGTGNHNADPILDFPISDGLYYSNDHGSTWLHPLDVLEITTIDSIDGTIFIGTAGNGIFRSFDEGLTWLESNTNFSSVNADCQNMIVNRNFIFTHAVPNMKDAGLFRSVNGGIEWTTSLTRTVTSINLIGSKLFAGILRDEELNSFGGLYFTSDWGETWTEANGLISETVHTVISSNGALFAAANRGIFKSIDGGVNWAEVNMPLQYSIVKEIVFFDGKMVAGTERNGLFYSNDGGDNWLQPNVPQNDLDITALIPIDDTLFAGSTEGIFLSSNGIDWIQANAPPINSPVNAITTNNGDLFAATGYVRGALGQGVLISSDGGSNWSQVNGPMKNRSVQALIAINGAIYAGTGIGVFRSLNAGQRWDPIVAGMSNQVNTFDYLPELNRLYAATEEGIYFQTPDTSPPIPISVTINTGSTFTTDRNASLIILATDADSMIISENPSFSDSKWQEYEINPSRVLSDGDGLKTLHLQFKDVSWNESEVISASITLDTQPPSFPSPTIPTNATSGQSILINQRVNEPNLDEMQLYFRRAGEPWSENRKITFQGNSAEIDGAFITNRCIDYRIVASDFAGHIDTLKNGKLDFISIPVQLATTDLDSSFGLPPGTAQASYKLISVPMQISGDPKVTTVLGDLGPYGPDGDWRFWKYTGTQWVEGDTVTLKNGQGYFLIRRNGGTLTNKISGLTNKTTDGVLGDIPGWYLHANGWTIIGNPYNTEIKLSQLKLKRQGTLLSEFQQDSTLQIWGYDAGWRNQDISLESWGGLAIRVLEPDTVVFANDSDPYVLSKPTPKLNTSNKFESLKENEWLVTVKADAEGFSDHLNYFGIMQDASDNLDKHDWFEPPLVPGGVSVSFQPEWENLVALSADIRPTNENGYQWQLQLVGKGGKAVNLSFENLAALSEELEVVLTDKTNMVQDLRSRPLLSVRMPEGAQSKSFIILVGGDDFIADHTHGLSTIPESFTLHQNYPNPFNPSTVIRYELPISGKVTLKVYDLLGREVMTLEDEENRESGYYEKIVDLSGSASGIYFYRIAVDGEKQFEATKKMLFVK